MTHRIERVNNLMREVLSAMLEREVKDPRLSGLTCITEVQTSPDMRHSRVFVSQVGESADREAVMAALRDATGFLRTGLSQKLHMRRIPELAFVWDDSIERGARILELIDKVSSKDSEASGD